MDVVTFAAEALRLCAENVLAAGAAVDWPGDVADAPLVPPCTGCAEAGLIVSMCVLMAPLFHPRPSM